MTEDQSATEQSSLRKWLAGNTLAAVSIAGALVYGVIRISYVGFYGEFGLDPEDVGIGYAATLARALPGMFVWAAGAFLAMVVYAVGSAWFEERSDGSRVTEIARRARVRRFATVFALGALGLLIVLAPFDAQRAAMSVKRGDELRAPSGLISWGIMRDPLGFTVREVNVDWVDGNTNAHTELGEPLMLLGSDSDVYYLYDVEFKRTLRLPRSLVILREDVG